eukprot:TRINITY_DN71154_c0_g1_i1.p3 TRINITY_DN71154_c0_g1~~TRINITY_DN71154_c0_g1_i1.p3  ORF type:complete len:184 (+),score=55.39 TRINITY_DN71154_c0_g1_i1:146-697(+)
MASGPWRARFEVMLDPETGKKGSFVLEVVPEWAPRGAQRFRELCEAGYYEGTRVHRVISGFMAQFGICGDPELYAKWGNAKIKDDPPRETNARGAISFAKAGPDARSTQVFINFRDNSSLDKDGFPPFGRVVEGMETVDQFYAGYGERAPKGNGPDPSQMKVQGQAYIEKWPKLSYIERVVLL